MAWEQANIIFPLGYTHLPDGNIISNYELQQSGIQTMYLSEERTARNMLTLSMDHIYGKDGEYALGISYDALNCLPHPESNISPLSVYGMRMLRDYMVLNDIDIKDSDEQEQE